jgi:hypothetical protein
MTTKKLIPDAGFNVVVVISDYDCIDTRPDSHRAIDNSGTLQGAVGIIKHGNRFADYYIIDAAGKKYNREGVAY